MAKDKQTPKLSPRDYLKQFIFSETQRYEIKADPRLHVLVSLFDGKWIVAPEALAPDGKWHVNQRETVVCRDRAEAELTAAELHRTMTRMVVLQQEKQGRVEQAAGPSKLPPTCGVCFARESNGLIVHQSGCPNKPTVAEAPSGTET